MLLPQKTHAVQHLARSGTSRFEPLPEIRVFDLPPLDSFGIHARSSRRGIERLDAGFGLERPPPEGRKLVAKVPDELLQLLKSFELRTFAV
jgi:hypothetical protein